MFPLLNHSIHHDPAVPIGPDQPDHSAVPDLLLQPINEDVVVDPVEKLLQVHVDYDPSTRLHITLRRNNGVVCASARTEAVAVPTESWIKHRLQHLQQSLLDQSIRDRRDAELALPSIRFRDRYPSYRFWPVHPCLGGHPKAAIEGHLKTGHSERPRH